MSQLFEQAAFAALLGGLLGLPFRTSHGARVGASIAIGSGAGVAYLLQTPWGWSLLAALSAAAVTLLLPGLGSYRRGAANLAGLATGSFSARASRWSARAPGLLARSSPSALLDPADRLRIEAAVLEAERSTTGEVVVVVVGSCAEYGSAGWCAGTALALLGCFGTLVFAPGTGPGGLLGVQAAGLVLGHLLARIPLLRRSLISEQLMQSCAERRAWSAFAENGLARTAGRTGILIFVALLEQRVILLSDEGVDRALGANQIWQEVVELLLAGVREERAAEGILAAVRRSGEILEAHLPAPPRSPNQLPTALILED